MTGARRVGATPIAPPEGTFTPSGRQLVSLGNPAFMEVDPRGPEFVYEEPFLDDDMPPVVLPVDDDTLFAVYMHDYDRKLDFSGYQSVYIRKLTHDANLPVRSSALSPAGGSASASRTNSPPRGARFDGETGSYAGGDIDFTWPFGDPDNLDIRMLILPDDWTPAADQILIEKWLDGDAAFRLTLKSNGHLLFEKAWTDGTTIDGTECSVAVDYTPGQPKWIRVTCFSGYQVKYWEVDNPNEEFPNWVQVGDTEDGSFSGLNMETAVPLFVGAGTGADLATPVSTVNEFTGSMYETQVWMESNLYFDAQFSAHSGGWTAGDSDGESIEVTNRVGTDTLTLHGGVEIRSALDLTDLIDLKLTGVSAADWTPVARAVVVGDENWEFSIEPSGVLRLSVAQDGATPTMVSASSSAGTGFGAGTPHNLRVTWTVATGAVKFYTSDPGAPTWVQLGTDQTITVTGVFDSTGSLLVGSGADGDPFTGTIERMDLYLDLIRATAPVFKDLPPGTTPFTDGLGVDWTFTGGASIVDVAGSTTEGFEVGDEVILWGGLAGVDAIPPLPSGSGKWNVDRGYVQVVPVDTDHVIVRFYDEDGWWDNEEIGTGDYRVSVGCSLVEIDWDTKTATWGPWNIIYRDEDDAYEFGYGDVGLTMRRLVFLPDGRFVTATTTWDDMSPTLIVGTMDYDTGIVTFGEAWLHPDHATDTNWMDVFSGMDLFVIDDTRVALFWKNYADIVLPDKPVNVAILDVENDDSMTLVDWANITMPDVEVSIEYTTDEVTFEQVRPGIFVGVFYRSGGEGSYLDMLSVNLADLTSNELEWSFLYGPPDDLDPVPYRSASLWDPDYGYPQYHRIAVTNFLEGEFVMTWQDETQAIPRTGPGAEFDATFVEIGRAFMMAEDMTFETTSAVLQASTSDMGENFEERSRYLGGLSGSVHDMICTATLFDHVANWWADPAPDPNVYTFGVLMVMKFTT